MGSLAASGFDFIEWKRPSDHIRNQQLHWIIIQVGTKESPIYKWPTALVNKLLRDLSQDGILASTQDMVSLSTASCDSGLAKTLLNPGP